MKKIILSLLIFSATLSWPLISFSHGDLAIVNERCTLSIGKYSAGFSGYQVQKPKAKFCNDIPDAGQFYVTLDFFDEAVSALKKDYRILRDDKKLGVDASLQDLGSAEEIEAATIFYLPGKQYPSSVMVVDSELEEGYYIGMVSLYDEQNTKTHTAVFPFAVGFGDKIKIGMMSAKTIAQMIILVLLGALFAAFIMLSNGKK